MIISSSKKDCNGIVRFNLRGGSFILLFYMVAMIFVEGFDKPLYLEKYLHADDYYDQPGRELFWNKVQFFLSIIFFKGEFVYWMFFSCFYCIAYYFIAQKYFPYRYAGYFILLVVGSMGFVSYGSNTIRAGFGLAILMFAYSSRNQLLSILLMCIAVGCNMPMLIPIMGFLMARYIIKKDRWCEYIWFFFLVITATTSVVSDIMTLAGGLDARADEFADADSIDYDYNVGFRFDFILYSLAPVFFVKKSMSRMIIDDSKYHTLYRTYMLVNALWLLLIRVPFTDRFAYLSWFMIPFLILYPVLNSFTNFKRPQQYLFSALCVFILINTVLLIKQIF